MKTTPPPRAPGADARPDLEVKLEHRVMALLVTMSPDQCKILITMIWWAEHEPGRLRRTSVAALALAFGVTRKVVDRTLARLEEVGAVRRVPIDGGFLRLAIGGFAWSETRRGAVIELSDFDDGAGVGQGTRPVTVGHLDGIPHPAEGVGQGTGRGCPTTKNTAGKSSTNRRIGDRSLPQLTPDSGRSPLSERSTPDNALRSRSGAKPAGGESEATPKEAPETESTGRGRKQGRRGATMAIPGLESPRRTATAIADDWHPSAAHGVFAKDLGLDLAWEADHFRDWCLARRQTYVDWDAAFRTRLRNSRKYSRSQSGPPPQGGPQEPVSPQAIRPMAEVKRGELLAPMPDPVRRP